MARIHKNNHMFRGLLQSEDGVISRVLDANSRSMTFETTFGVSEEMIMTVLGVGVATDREGAGASSGAASPLRSQASSSVR